MRSRRKLFSIIGAFAVVLGGGVYAATSPALALTSPAALPVRVTNDTGRGESVYLYVIGTNVNTGKLGYVDASGDFVNWPAGANPPVPAPDVAIPGPGNGASTTVEIPRGLSARLYFSFGDKLKLFLTPDGLVQPAPWADGDANRNILFDWSEFTYNDAGLWLNSSQVDMFAIPHTVTVTGSAGTHSTGTLVADGREKVIDGIKSAGMGGAVQTRSDGTVLRVLAPGKASDAGHLAPTGMDQYISSAWGAYSSKTLTVVPFADQPDKKFFGHTAGNVMTFTDGSGKQVASFNKPSSADVWGCAGNLGAPNDQVVGPIARSLCAALNRGTLGTVDTQPTTDASQFYEGDHGNLYSKIVHSAMADGKAYGFAFDDVGNFESLVHDDAPTSAAITLNPFSGGGAPNTGDTPPTAKPAPSESGPATGDRLISQYDGKCLDVPARDFADGRRLNVWGCAGGDNQSWHMADGAIHTKNNLCVDAAGAGTADGTPIQIATCSGAPAQKFVLNGSGELVNSASGKCVDINAYDSHDGAPVQLWGCNGGLNQKWRQG